MLVRTVELMRFNSKIGDFHVPTISFLLDVAFIVPFFDSIRIPILILATLDQSPFDIY
jgi:hypothetical protein